MSERDVRSVQPRACVMELSRMTEIAKAVHLVVESDETDTSIVESELNPYWLKCEVCKAWCQLNFCSHVLTVTNVKMQRLPPAEHIACINVVKLLERVDDTVGVDALTGAASTSRVRGRKATALIPESGGKKGVYSSAKNKRDAEAAKAKRDGEKQARTRKGLRMSKKQIAKGALLGQQQQAKKKIRDAAKQSSPGAQRRRVFQLCQVQSGVV